MSQPLRKTVILISGESTIDANEISSYLNSFYVNSKFLNLSLVGENR